MSVFRKENGSLVKKAGRALVDLALSLTSNNAIANRVVTENLNQKVTKFSGTDSGNTYVTVDQLAYDLTNKKLGLKVNGADTVIPFSGGGAKLVGTYYSDSSYITPVNNDTNTAHYLAVCSSTTTTSNASTYYDPNGTWSAAANATYTRPYISSNGSYISLTVGKVSVATANPARGSASSNLTTRLYYVGDIS